MAEIYLANGRGIALIDDEDVGRVPSRWHLHPQGYAAKHSPMVNGQRSTLLLHRVVMDARPDQEIDHINHDKLDCRKANLRFVTRSQNNQNWPGPLHTNKLGIRGVIRYSTKSGERYRAAIQLNGKHIQKWGFRNLEEAASFAAELRRTHFTHSPEPINGR